MPGFVPILAIIVVVAVLGLMMFSGNAPNNQGVQNQNTNELPPAPEPIIPQEELPTNAIGVELSPVAPVAGNDVTFTATLKPEFVYANWQDDFSFEIWVRQFGNWSTHSCYSSPCSYTYNTVSTGTIEYEIKRLQKTDEGIETVTDGSYSLDIPASVATGDTLPPKIVVSHDPANPKLNGKVTITASVEDISGLDQVEVYLDDALVKTCPQNVKISHCAYDSTSLSVGEHSYYAKATDVKGNTGSTTPATFVVSSS